MKTELLNIINGLQPDGSYLGLHALSCKDFMKLSRLSEKEPDLCNDIDYKAGAFYWVEWWEERTVGKWVEKYHAAVGHRLIFQPALITESQIYCEVEKPKSTKGLYKRHEQEEYQQAQQQKIIEGCFKEGDKICLVEGHHGIYYHPTTNVLVVGQQAIIDNPTWHDLIYHLDKYNSTAKERIVIMATPNFLNGLV